MRYSGIKYPKNSRAHELRRVLLKKFGVGGRGKIIRGLGGVSSLDSLGVLIDAYTNEQSRPDEIYDILTHRRAVNVKKNSSSAKSSNKVQRAGGASAGAHFFLSAVDFANVLSDAINLTAVHSFDVLRARQSFSKWVYLNAVPSYQKPIERVQVDALGDMTLQLEGADGGVVTGSPTHELDRVETYQLATYKKNVAITRQSFLSDSTGAFESVFTSTAAAAGKEADLVFEQLTDGTVGGKPTFSAENQNISTAASVADAVKVMMSQLRLQKAWGSETPMGLSLGYLVVPSALEYDAHQVRYELFGENTEIGFEVCVEPRLDAKSADSLYGIAAEVSQVPFMDLASYQGEKPLLRIMETFHNDAINFCLTHHIAAKVLNHESAQKCTITTS